MNKIKNDELLKDKPDYENYSENICDISIEELKKEGILRCGGCCSNNKKCCKSK